MRAPTDIAKLERFMRALGDRVRSEGTIYLTGGGTALLHHWRDSTIDIDVKADPEPAGFFEAIAALKDEMDVNVELASPDDFVPPVPGWQERSPMIARYGAVTFRHFDPYSQVLAKLERGNDRDQADAEAFVQSGLVTIDRLRAAWSDIEPLLLRYPAIDPIDFRNAVVEFCAHFESEEAS